MCINNFVCEHILMEIREDFRFLKGCSNKVNCRFPKKRTTTVSREEVKWLDWHAIRKFTINDPNKNAHILEAVFISKY